MKNFAFFDMSTRMTAGFLAAMMLAQPAMAAAPALRDIGPAPEFAGIGGWVNSPPLTMAQLKGKVVLVDFWAYSCINCLRTLPYLNRWAKDYKDNGLVVIGVHAPEFKFEQDIKNVTAAVSRLGITYPVAQDNQMKTWEAFHNEYWPEEYLIDRNGHIVYSHAGEGHYDVTENAIRTLLAAGPAVGPEPGVDLSKVTAPEMYFGIDRVMNLHSPGGAQVGTHPYTLPDSLDIDNFALAGTWTLNGESATLAKDGGKIKLYAHTGKVFMVASAKEPVTLSITVDGKKQPDVSVQESRLYTIFDSTKYKDHTVVISIPKAGLKAYTFTFG